MDVLIVLVFVSLVLVAAALLLFAVSLRQRDFEHSERLALLPLSEPRPLRGPSDAAAAHGGGTTPLRTRPTAPQRT